MNKRFYGWWVTVAAFITFGFAVGLPYYSMPFFYDYYDCSAGELSHAILEDQRAQVELALLVEKKDQLRMESYSFMIARGWHMADADIVAKICGR